MEHICSKAKNATFLFHRNFMEYHDSRFKDHSIIVLDNSKWVAILPANCVENKLYSHQGLTYGGLIYNEELKLAAILLYFQAILEYLHVNRIEKLEIKSIPNIYHKKPQMKYYMLCFYVKEIFSGEIL